MIKTERVHTLILGAGPSGLTAGYLLAKAGVKPVVLEKDRVSGGLMRSIRRGDFIVDIGRKELYNRLSKVDEFWSGLLGRDYRTYENRGGILYDGRIIDVSRKYLGFRRGMPWSMFLGCILDFLWWRAKPHSSPPRNLEEYWYRHRGRQLTRIANQGFQEKLSGSKWVDIHLPGNLGGRNDESFLRTVSQALARLLLAREPDTYENVWRHPARGTGQICELLERGVVESGGCVHHGARVLEMSAAEGAVRSVRANVGTDTILFEPSYVVSSAPAEFLQELLLPGRSDVGSPDQRPLAGQQRTAVLAYLFFDEGPQFPHFWLHVTCRKLKVGRIANYAALNSDMVPKGKTALCCEYYCFGEDSFLDLDDRQIGEFALEECARAGLVHREKCFDTMVVRCPGADASQNRHNWFSKERTRLFSELRQFHNLYPVNRTDLDIATLAGIESAGAILSSDRRQFDQHFSPDVLGIQGQDKPFEFRNPLVHSRSTI